MEKIEKSVEDKRKQIVEKDEENKELIKQLKELKVKYGKLPSNNQNDDDDDDDEDENDQDDDE